MLPGGLLLSWAVLQSPVALPVTISFSELACHTNATYPVTPPSLCNYAHLGESLREIKISKM